MTLTSYPGSDTWRSGNAYFICDRCGQRWRRSAMLTEWTGLKVDARCLDPRPPQMQPPNVYPEGIPFFDARVPQDGVDRRLDDSFITNVVGGMETSVGTYPSGQPSPPGAISPQHLIVDPIPQDTAPRDLVADDVTLRTGLVPAPSVDVSDSPGPIPFGQPNPPFD